MRNQRGDGAFWIDGAYPLTSEGKLPTGQDVTFFIYALNNTNYNIAGMTNGFKVYSPEGADWNSTVGTTMPDHPWDSWFDLTFSINPFSCDGSGADTVGFGGSRLFSTGLPSGFDDTAYTITIGPIASSETGKMICLDSSWYPPTNRWKWTAGASGDFYPVWGGPYCWTIGAAVAAPITFRGNLYYNDPTPKPSGPDTTLKPMRNILVEMRDWDVNPVDSELLWWTRTDSSGYFEFNNIFNADSNGTGSQDVYFRVLASVPEGSVVKDTIFTLHEWRTAIWNDMPGGTYDTVMIVPTDSSGPFFVADAYLDAQLVWDSLRPSGQFELIDGIVALAKDSIQTGYNIGDDYIFINDSVDAAHEWPDTWDRSTILHEFGHRIAHNFDFCDDTTGSPASHDFWEIHNLEFAALEGFAHWWSTVVDGTPMRTKYWADFTDSSWANFENGEYGDAIVRGSFNARGPECEGAVAGIWWDIYDGADDDYSGLGDYGLTRLPHTPDNIGDTLSMGHERILAVLLDNEHLGHRPDNIDEFWAVWFGPRWHRHEQAMKDIWYEHGDSTKGGCCVGIRGNVNGDPGELVDIADLLYLTDYMFTEGQEPPCMSEAAVTGDPNDDVDISDLVWLVDYMFTGGPEPWPCP